ATRRLLGVTVDRDLDPHLARDLLEHALVDLLTLLQKDLPLFVDELSVRRLAEEVLAQLAIDAVAQDLDLFVARLLQARALHVLDLLRALVFVRPFAREDASVDDDAADARRNAQGRVPHVPRLFAEDRAEQLFFG